MKKGIGEGEREVGGDGVCGCSFDEPLKHLYIFKHVLKNNFVLFI
jgi:hypothetical protein